MAPFKSLQQLFGRSKRITERNVKSNTIDTQNIRQNAITADKITVNTLSAIKAELGNVTVGGLNDEDGTISVRDSTDTEKVLIDSDGMTISSGKITIKDDDETTIIDSIGLVSTANFGTSALTKTAGADFFVTSTTQVDVTDATFTVSPERDTTYMFFFHATFYSERESGGSGDWAGNMNLNFIENGTRQEPGMRSNGQYNSTAGNEWYRGSANSYAIGSMHYLTTLSSGSNTVKIAGRLTTDTDCQFRIFRWRFSYIKLGI